MTLYSHWKKVEVWQLKPGDHIRVDRELYYHHMLVVEVVDAARGEVMVIHYTTISSLSKALLSGDSAIIEEEQFLEEVEKAVYKDHVRVYSPHQAIQRARSRAGEQEYSVYFNNCESFVNWALTSQDVTDQGTQAAVGTAVLGAAVVGATAYGLRKVFGGTNSSKKQDE